MSTLLGINFIFVLSLIAAGYSEDSKTIAKNTLKNQIDLIKTYIC
jgi:hypothetical protein